MSGKPIAKLVAAPVVNDNSVSPEAIMARNAKLTQEQADTDGHYDTVLERFCGGTPFIAGLTVALSLFLVSLIVQKGR